MNLITIEQARVHCKSEGDDDELLLIYCDAAEAACERLANRSLFKDSTAMATAWDSLIQADIDALAAYDAAITAAKAMSDPRVVEIATQNADWALQDHRNKAYDILHGKVVTPDIISAVLLIVGHLYVNREEVVAGQGAAAVQVPMAAQAIMSHHRWLGPL